MGHLLLGGIQCTKIGNFQAKGLKVIEWTTFFQRLAVKLWPLTTKSIGVIFSPGSSTVPNSATFKQRGQKILSGGRFVYRQTDLDRHTNRLLGGSTDRQVQTKCPFFAGGIKTKRNCAKIDIEFLNFSQEIISKECFLKKNSKQ